MQEITYSTPRKRRRTRQAVDPCLGFWKDFSTSEVSCISTSSDRNQKASEQRVESTDILPKRSIYAGRKCAILSSPDCKKDTLPPVNPKSIPPSEYSSPSLRPPKQKRVRRAIPSSPDISEPNNARGDVTSTEKRRRKAVRSRPKASELIAELHAYIPPRSPSPPPSPSGKAKYKSLTLLPTYSSESKRRSRYLVRTGPISLPPKQKCLSAFPQPAFASRSTSKDRSTQGRIYHNLECISSKQQSRLACTLQSPLSNLSIPRIPTHEVENAALPMITASQQSLRASLRVGHTQRSLDAQMGFHQTVARGSVIKIPRIGDLAQEHMAGGLTGPESFEHQSSTPLMSGFTTSHNDANRTPRVNCPVRPQDSRMTEEMLCARTCVSVHSKLNVEVGQEMTPIVTISEFTHPGKSPIRETMIPKTPEISVFDKELTDAQHTSPVTILPGSSRGGTHRPLQPMAKLFSDLLETARSVAAKSQVKRESAKAPKYTDTKLETYFNRIPHEDLSVNDKEELPATSHGHNPAVEILAPASSDFELTPSPIGVMKPLPKTLSEFSFENSVAT